MHTLSRFPFLKKKSMKKRRKQTTDRILRKKQKEQNSAWPLPLLYLHCRRGRISDRGGLGKNVVTQRHYTHKNSYSQIFKSSEYISHLHSPWNKREDLSTWYIKEDLCSFPYCICPQFGNSVNCNLSWEFCHPGETPGSTFSLSCFCSASTHPSPLFQKCVLCAASSTLQLR